MKNKFVVFIAYFVFSSSTIAENITDIKNKTQSLKKEIEYTLKRKTLIEAEVSKIATQIKRLIQEKNKAKESYKNTQIRINETLEKISVQKHLINTLFESYKKDLLALYDSGYVNKNLQLDPRLSPKLIDYMPYIIESRKNKALKLNNSLRKLESLEYEKRFGEKEVLLRLKEIESSEKQLSISSESQRTLLANLSRDLSSKTKKLTALKEDQTRLAKLVSKRALLDNNQKLGPLQGKLKWPVEGQLTHRFGETRSDGFGTWNGVVIKTPENIKVLAVQGGQIAYSGYLLGYGLVVVIAHKDGYATIYGHNKTLSVKSGQFVKANEVIAITGNTGSLDYSGLYFALSKEGKSKNPTQWLSP